MRELLPRQHTVVINQVRGLLAERGIVMAQSPAVFARSVPEVLARCDDEFTTFCRTLVGQLLEQFHTLDERSKCTEEWIKDIMRRSPLCTRIAAIDGIGR